MKRHLSDIEINLLVDDSSEAETVEPKLMEHLDSCSTCRDELFLAQTVEKELLAVPRMVAPPELFEGVMATIATARAKQRRTAAVFASLAAAVLVFVGWWLLAGGAAAVALDALEVARAARMLSTVATAIGETMPVELLATLAFVLMGSSAALGRLMTRLNRGPEATAVAG